MSFPFGVDIIVFFFVLSFVASIINGGLGYGYSSISTPLALLVVVSRILNPAFVLLEAVLNTAMLGFSGRKNIAAVTKRNLPIIGALVPGVFVGSLALSAIAPIWIRLFVYVVLLPLILLQAAGIRRPIRNEKAVGVPLGVGIGVLYSLTTISGPPIALFWNNQGLKKAEFKASLAQIRITESYLTSVSYYFLGLFSATSLSLFTIIAPPVLIGIPTGIFIVRRVSVETFRRICMSFDAWIVGYGLTRTLISVLGLAEVLADGLWTVVIGIDLMLLYRFFKRKASEEDIRLATPGLLPKDRFNFIPMFLRPRLSTSSRRRARNRAAQSSGWAQS